MTEPKAMIVKLSVKAWGATRTDKSVSDEVAAMKGAAPDAGKYVKNLIDKSALREVRTCTQNLRDLHKTFTRPWDDDGRRLLPLDIAPTYETEIENAKNAFEAAVGSFIREYSGLRDYAQMNLGDLFNEADYPSEGEIAERFGVTVDYEPVPEGKYAPPEYASEVEAAVQRKMKASHDELIYRIRSALADLNRKIVAHDERIKAGDLRGRFRLSVMDELTQLTDILPALNIEKDPFIEGIIERLKNDVMVDDIDPERLRDVASERRAVVSEVEELIDHIDGGK